MTYIDAEMRGDYLSIVAWDRRIQAIPEVESLYATDVVEKRKHPPNLDGRQY